MSTATNKMASLLASTARLDAPFVRVTIGNQTFGVYNKSRGKVTFPNLITSLSIKKINGLVNAYTLELTYPITQESDPNAIEMLLSSDSKKRRIVFDYGDAVQPNYVYRSEEAIITDVKTNVDVKSSTISYTITAQSTALESLSAAYTLGGIYGKPSAEIIRILNDTRYGLLDIFTGMKNHAYSEFIATTNDHMVNIPTYKGITALEYISNLVACMSPGIYTLATFEGSEGPYFKVIQVESKSTVLSNIISYSIDIGYPTAEIVTEFRLVDDSNWALLYDYAENTSITDTLQRLDNSGEIYFKQGTLKKGMSYELPATQQKWWEKVTAFPIKAELKLKGLLKPTMLMQYLKINVWFFGRKHSSSGYYIITGQTDNINMNDGYTTTLNLTRIAGEEIDSSTGSTGASISSNSSAASRRVISEVALG